MAPGQELSLQAGSPSDFGDAELGQLAADFAGTNLTDLNLSGTDVTDAGLVHLAGLTNLTWLNLGSCPRVTDRGLAPLASLTNLRWLGLAYTGLMASTGVTDAGVAALKAKLPGCTIGG